ncbi:MAG: hypothetical protein ABH834_04520, partial [Candidatus Altiarchaeota archaeon]
MDLIGWIKDFLGSDFNKALTVILLVVGAFAYMNSPEEIAADSDTFVHFFYMPTCPHCREQHGFNDQLEEKYGIKIIEYDVTTTEGSTLFSRICGEYDLMGYVPTTIVGGKVFVGFDEETGNKIEEAVVECLDGGCEDAMEEACTVKETFVVSLPLIGEKDLRQYSLPMLAIMIGLIDGFNPCAMWVLVYMIALVINLKDRSRAWIIVGTFVAASGTLYFLFMTAWLNAFLLIGYLKIVTIVIGLLALGGGTLQLKEYIEKKGAIECEIGDAESKKKTMNKLNELLHAPLTLPTIIGIVALAFVVNSIEFACSAALPAIFTQILALSNLSFWQHYLYIGLY